MGKQYKKTAAASSMPANAVDYEPVVFKLYMQGKVSVDVLERRPSRKGVNASDRLHAELRQEWEHTASTAAQIEEHERIEAIAQQFRTRYGREDEN